MTTRKAFYASHGKRALDVSASALALLVCLPPMGLLWAIGRRVYGNPIFTQERTGLGERHFKIIKFKTMHNTVNSAGQTLPDSQRLDRYGRFLRKTSLDELPELLCILKGEMSFIGPRPLLTRYDPYYSPLERNRFNVRPGLLGLAQVSGRNSLAWDARLAYDVYYADNLSMWLDMRILVKGMRATLTSHGHVPDPSGKMLDLDVERSQ